MAQTHKLSQMDIQPGWVQDHFLQNVLKFGFGDWKNVYETRGKQVFVLTNWRFIIKVLCI